MAFKQDEQAKEKDLAELKVIAEELGVEYADTIGYPTLEKRVKSAQKEKKAAKTAKPKKMSDIQVKVAQAKHLKKVMVTNMDPNNAGQSTVFVSCHNMHMDLARAVPLGMEIALEQALIDAIKMKKAVTSVPHMIDGRDTGNTVAKEVPMYAIAEL